MPKESSVLCRQVCELGTSVQIYSAMFTFVQVLFFYFAILGSTYYGATMVIHRRGDFNEGIGNLYSS